MDNKAEKHGLVDDALNRQRDGVYAKCVCGWVSGPHVSGIAASAAFREHIDKQIGPTGDFPAGRKLNNEDEGGLAIALTVEDGVVMIRFGKPVAWIGMPKDNAIVLANMIINAAGKLP